jgi:hypothetical protein
MKTMVKAGIIAIIAGLLGLAFVPPACLPAMTSGNMHYPPGAVINLAWACAITGGVIGIGIGLLLAALWLRKMNTEDKDRTRL